jgi:hypothetical protein
MESVKGASWGVVVCLEVGTSSTEVVELDFSLAARCIDVLLHSRSGSIESGVDPETRDNRSRNLYGTSFSTMTKPSKRNWGGGNQKVHSDASRSNGRPQDLKTLFHEVPVVP